MKQGLDATYENLLKLFVEAEFTEYADVLCDVIREKCKGM